MVKTIRRSNFIILVLGVLAMLMSSCQWMSEEYDDEIADSSAAQYINITVSVSASNSPVTRANPTGGEYGDGPEKGDDRENEVKNITLIFYQDDNGINTNSLDTEVVEVLSYDVHEYTDSDRPKGHDHKTGEPTDVQTNEVLYTTGDKELRGTNLEAGKTYKVIVVANANPGVQRGDKIVSDKVREKVLSKVYSGTGVGVNATDFVMASESDASVRLVNPTVYTSYTVPEDNRYVYYFECIHIERLAARIDYWAKNASYTETFNHKGYAYEIKDLDNQDTGDRFVLTSITPFNLNNGNEFMLKRVVKDFGPAGLQNATILGDEKETTGNGPDKKGNFVLDPYTVNKVITPPVPNPDYLVSKLTDVLTAFNNSYTVSLADERANKKTIESIDNIVIGYTKENTLRPSQGPQNNGGSPLYYYATGLAFEGYYYEAGATEGKRYVFYYFIRHQGEAATATDSYYALTKEQLEVQKETLKCPETPSMNYGIVRNNIYRVSIESVSLMRGKLTIKLEEEKWRHVDNPAIYI